MTQMKEVKRIGVVSMAKVMGVLYLVLSLLVALPLACFSLFSGSLFASAGFEDPETLGLGFATGIVGALIYAICLPLFYAVIGFIAGAIIAFVYNILAGSIGGIELELGDAGSKY